MVKGRKNRSKVKAITQEEVDGTNKKLKTITTVNAIKERKNSTNIFLQEPVLSLDFDKTPNMKTRIIVKNSLLSNEHYQFNSSPTVSPEHNVEHAIYNCQENVDTINGLSGNCLNDSLPASPISVKMNKKPSTPHRIICEIIEPEITVSSHSVPPVQKPEKKKILNLTTRKRLHKEPENVVNEAVQKKMDVPESAKPVLNSVTNPTAKQNSKNNKNLTETFMTDFFPVRRSVRKTTAQVKEQNDLDILAAIKEGREEGLKIQKFQDKGRGIVTTRAFAKGEFVVEYIGDLINVAEANKREAEYALDDSAGCYMYYFKHKNIQYCIDATSETGKMGRLVNHSRNGNLTTRTFTYQDKPHLVLVAKNDIDAGVEVTYDYGDRSKESLLHHPWLAY